MKTKNLFSTFLVLAFLLTACGQGTATPAPVTQPPFATQSPTDIPTLTPVPTLVPLFQTLSPTTPYPTASVVKANAVAFIAENALWVANVDGSGERKLTSITANKRSASNLQLQWSPDGKWISYFSGDELWIVSPDGQTNKKVLPFTNLYTYVWSPDGSKIAFNRMQTEAPLTIGILDVEIGKTFEVSTHLGPDPMPLSWSPDGRYFLFTKPNAFVLFNVNARKVAKEIKQSGMGCWLGWNSWSPNGKWFSHSYHGNGYYASDWTCVSSLDNGATWQIENTSDTSSGGVWDKTGNYLYFVMALVHKELTKEA